MLPIWLVLATSAPLMYPKLSVPRSGYERLKILPSASTVLVTMTPLASTLLVTRSSRSLIVFETWPKKLLTVQTRPWLLNQLVILVPKVSAVLVIWEIRFQLFVSE